MWSSFSSILVEKAPRRTRRRKKKKSTRRVCARFANSEDFFLFLQRSVEMAEEFVDIVVLGASGFTGKYVLRELLKFRNVTGREPRKIGIAGRSKKKLAAALTWAAAAASSSSSSSAVAGGGNDPDNASPPSVVIYEADVNDMASLRAVCRKTRVLVSCVGPYRKYGQPVVEACVEAGVDYLDITGEPEFMERMEVLYHEKAKQSGAIFLSFVRRRRASSSLKLAALVVFSWLNGAMASSNAKSGLGSDIVSEVWKRKVSLLYEESP
jgi:hypothetical protein